MPEIQGTKLAAKGKRVMNPRSYLKQKNEELANSPFVKKLTVSGLQRVMSPKTYLAHQRQEEEDKERYGSV